VQCEMLTLHYLCRYALVFFTPHVPTLNYQVAVLSDQKRLWKVRNTYLGCLLSSIRVELVKPLSRSCRCMYVYDLLLNFDVLEEPIIYTEASGWILTNKISSIITSALIQSEVQICEVRMYEFMKTAIYLKGW
jgi:hypothetical protein